MSLFACKNLTKSYGKKVVISDVALRVEEQEIVGLLGPNGAGKTTTFSMVMGLIRPDSGSIHFLDQDITSFPVAKRARLGMGYLAQEPSVFRKLNVRDNILAVLEWVPGLTAKDRTAKMEAILAELNLTSLAKQRADLLSGGERRRLEIARILVTEPSLVLLDEPFAGVDPIAVEEIQALVCSLRDRGISILITDHNVRETLSITDRSYIIAEGSILKHGPANELVQDEQVRRAYLGKSFTMTGMEAPPQPKKPEDS